MTGPALEHNSNQAETTDICKFGGRVGGGGQYYLLDFMNDGLVWDKQLLFCPPGFLPMFQTWVSSLLGHVSCTLVYILVHPVETMENWSLDKS